MFLCYLCIQHIPRATCKRGRKDTKDYWKLKTKNRSQLPQNKKDDK
ncbi:hypothetical protein L950_0224045 [Sphingobacterium sp. IITKGP-BTPF85]|nr:hypothetical protein L950_0224045 [Sphingobacterium sp. IITKGP-BTPF85]